MHRFLKNTALFSLAVILVLILGEIVVRRVPTSYSYKADWLMEHGADVNTLVLGSSHTYYGIRSDVLGDSVFNLANVSQTPEYDLALLQHFAPYMPNLKRIIIPISYFTFRDPLLEEMLPNFAVNYKVGMNLPLHPDMSLYNFYVISDFTAYAGRLRSLILDEDANRCDSLGFGLGFDLSHRDRNWENQGKARVGYLTHPSVTRPIEVLATLEETLNWCREKGIECVLVSTPTWHTFNENTDETQLLEVRRLTEGLVEKYGLRYYDMSVSPLFTDEDFYDTDHLSDIGATRFTRLLRDSIQAGSDFVDLQ